MTQTEMVSKQLNRLQDVVSPALSLAGLAHIDDYIDRTLDSVNKRQLSLTIAEGEESPGQISEAFYMQIHLPGEKRPDQYLSALWPALRSGLAPQLIGMTSREMTHRVWYPGEHPLMGATALIEIEVRYTRPCDDSQEEQ